MPGMTTITSHNDCQKLNECKRLQLSGGHGTRTRNRLPGTTFPGLLYVCPLTSTNVPSRTPWRAWGEPWFPPSCRQLAAVFRLGYKLATQPISSPPIPVRRLPSATNRLHASSYILASGNDAAPAVIYLITLRSPVPIPFAPPFFAGLKSGYRRTIERAKVDKHWLSSFQC
jgi:hypothetical protein